MTAWSNALRDWTEMESEAWAAYQRARTQMLRPPPESQRIAGPPELVLCNPLALQLQAVANQGGEQGRRCSKLAVFPR